MMSEPERPKGRYYRVKNGRVIESWALGGIEDLKAQQKTYREAHKDELKAKKKTYYEAHKDELKAKKKTYYEAHKDELKAKKKTEKTRIKQALNAIEKLKITDPELYEKLIEEDST